MFSKPGSGPAVLRKVTQEASKVDPAKRRDFLKKGLMVAGGAIAGTQFASTLHASQNNLPPNLAGVEQIPRRWCDHQSLWSTFAFRG